MRHVLPLHFPLEGGVEDGMMSGTVFEGFWLSPRCCPVRRRTRLGKEWWTASEQGKWKPPTDWVFCLAVSKGKRGQFVSAISKSACNIVGARGACLLVLGHINACTEQLPAANDTANQSWIPISHPSTRFHMLCPVNHGRWLICIWPRPSFPNRPRQQASEHDKTLTLVPCYKFQLIGL